MLGIILLVGTTKLVYVRLKSINNNNRENPLYKHLASMTQRIRENKESGVQVPTRASLAKWWILSREITRNQRPEMNDELC